jgi:hypothetical protein
MSDKKNCQTFRFSPLTDAFSDERADHLIFDGDNTCTAVE